MRRTWAMGLFAGSLVHVSAALEISPKNPTDRDPVVLTVRRSFTEDCLWKVAPNVRRERGKIDVMLELSGGPACDHALTDRSFEISVGPFPAGDYVLSVRWSDGYAAPESTPLRIRRARVRAR